ncbi:MAG: NTP transferase domain-containing protein [Phycisphaerales bacterium]
MDESVVAAILAGGAGRRMGGNKPAARLPDGQSLLAAVAQTAGQVAGVVWRIGGPAGDIGPDDARHMRHVPDLRPGLGPVAGIEAAARAMLDGLTPRPRPGASGPPAPDPSTRGLPTPGPPSIVRPEPLLLVLPCDMPDLPAAWLQALIQAARAAGGRPHQLVVEDALDPGGTAPRDAVRAAAGEFGVAPSPSSSPPRSSFPLPLVGAPARIAAAAEQQLDADDRRLQQLIRALDTAAVRVPARAMPWLRNVNDNAARLGPRPGLGDVPAISESDVP